MQKSSTSSLPTTVAIKRLPDYRFDLTKVEEEFHKQGRNLGGAGRALGELGEQLARWVVNGRRSSDRWNETGDMLDPDGKHVEVKTQNRYRRYHKEFDRDLDIFSVKWAPEGEKHHTNLEKCKTVDRLVFVEYRPILKVSGWDRPYDTDFHDWVYVYECTDRQIGAGRYRAGENWMYSWPIEFMTFLHSEHNPYLAAEFRRYSSAGNSLD